MSNTTRALTKGLKQMLKNRGSMTVEEERLLSDALNYVKKHEKLRGKERLQNAATIVEFLLRFLLYHEVGDTFHQIASSLLNTLL